MTTHNADNERIKRHNGHAGAGGADRGPGAACHRPDASRQCHRAPRPVMRWKSRRVGLIGSIILLLALAGCATELRVMMATPTLYLTPERDVYADLAAPLKQTEVRLSYITDRKPETDENGKLRYGSGRSLSVGFGTAVVDLGTEISWAELLTASRTRHRLDPVQLELRDVTEIVRGPDTPVPYTLVDGKIVLAPAWFEKLKASSEMFRQNLVRQLDLTPRKEVFLYIHGYNNSFDDAAFGMAELWHFLGRIGVPMIYTWPAGYPGLFGYTYDRESSEFTIYHLREVLSLMSSFPEVEKIHLIAHSRGTDVAVAALRELTIEARAAGVDPKKRFKIHNLVLAAPDLDVDVAVQRMGGDWLAESVHRWTIYTSKADKAIGYASTLFASPRGRVGSFRPQDAPDILKAWVKITTANFSVVDFSGEGEFLDGYVHSYFRDAPSVSSDLVLMLRDDLDAGSPGRPLEHLGEKFWRVPPGYPRARPAQSGQR